MSSRSPAESSLNISAHHLSLGDQVIVLDENGQIKSQGSAETVTAPMLSIQTETSNKTTPSPAKEGEDDDEVWQEIDMLINPTIEENRHAGDMKIYAYYANIAGWWIIGVYLFACCTFVFGVTFPCMLSPVNKLTNTL